MKELSKSGQRARINFILPRRMKADWLELAIKLNLTLSQLIRLAVKNFSNNLINSGNISMNDGLLGRIQDDNVSDIIEKTVKKKRLRGMIKIQRNIPLKKLALALEITEEKAEKLIYELASEDEIEGNMVEDVFEFKNDPEVIINQLSNLIEKM